jgi:hypothetical protein
LVVILCGSGMTGRLWARPAPIWLTSPQQQAAQPIAVLGTPETVSPAAFEQATPLPAVVCQSGPLSAPQRTGLLENLSIFWGAEGSKQPQDVGAGQFGGRAALNWGLPVSAPWGLGAQFGTTIDAMAATTSTDWLTLGSIGRTQNFTTFGVFHRTRFGANWGVVYDLLAQQYYDATFLGQWRINVSLDVTPRSTFGAWSALNGFTDRANYGTTEVILRPITQTNVYWRYQWPTSVFTTLWCGMANRRSLIDPVQSDAPRFRDTFVFGAELLAPLTDRLAIFGQSNFITPVASGTVDAYLGFVFYPRGGVRRAYSATYAPLQSVAAPTNFAVDLRRP